MPKKQKTDSLKSWFVLGSWPHGQHHVRQLSSPPRSTGMSWHKSLIMVHSHPNKPQRWRYHCYLRRRISLPVIIRYRVAPSNHCLSQLLSPPLLVLASSLSIRMNGFKPCQRKSRVLTPYPPRGLLHLVSYICLTQPHLRSDFPEGYLEYTCQFSCGRS